MNTNKSPYEIRANLLQLAFDILREQHAAANKARHCGYTAPTIEEIVAEAERLNTFVSQKANNLK